MPCDASTRGAIRSLILSSLNSQPHREMHDDRPAASDIDRRAAGANAEIPFDRGDGGGSALLEPAERRVHLHVPEEWHHLDAADRPPDSDQWVDGFRRNFRGVPWIESAVDLAIDPAADQAWEPRAFKSHLSCTKIPPGGRYITVFRDPRTVLPSFYRFFEGWFFEPGSISVTDFGRGLYMGGSASGRHWQHLIDWWPRIGDPNVLALSYEDMLLTPDAVPALVAEFLAIELDPEALKQVVHNCGRDAMTEHAEKFEEGILRVHRDHILGLPPGGSAAKVNAQSSSGLPPELVQELDAVWADTVGEALGFDSYDEFRRALPNPLGATR